MNRRERRASKSQLYFKAFYYQQMGNMRRSKTALTSIFKRRAFDFYSHVQR